MLKLKPKQLLEKEEFMNIKQVYRDNIYYAYTKMQFEYTNGQLDQKEEKELLAFLMTNDIICQEIMKCISNQIEKEKDLFSSIFLKSTNKKQNN